jgi:hypothetical protein
MQVFAEIHAFRASLIYLFFRENQETLFPSFLHDFLIVSADLWPLDHSSQNMHLRGNIYEAISAKSKICSERTKFPVNLGGGGGGV